MPCQPDRFEIRLTRLWWASHLGLIVAGLAGGAWLAGLFDAVPSGSDPAILTRIIGWLLLAVLTPCALYFIRGLLRPSQVHTRIDAEGISQPPYDPRPYLWAEIERVDGTWSRGVTILRFTPAEDRDNGTERGGKRFGNHFGVDHNLIPTGWGLPPMAQTVAALRRSRLRTSSSICACP